MRLRVLIVALVVMLAALPASSKVALPMPAQDLLNQGRVDDAIAQLQARIQKNPNDAEAHHLLSRAYLMIESWDKAVPPAEQAVALEPDNSDYHLWLGRAYGRKAEHSIFFKAIGWARKCKLEFERAVELNAANVPARADLAEYYLEAPSFLGGGKDKAQAQAEEIASRDKAAAHMVRARVAEDGKDYDTAERELWAAIAASNEPAGYWLDLAAFYRRRDRLNDMEDATNKAVAADKQKDPAILVQAAALLLRAGRNLPGAAVLARKALSSPVSTNGAPSFQAHYLLGQALEKQGDNAGAEREYRAALSLARDYKQAQKALKHIQEQQN
ncbi:MAG TPA: tetratricopeptide repeat protein [Terriglobales bacterium]|nr:tetratricopeptide repeat protein [Terriglobales bacterium]